MSEEKQFDPSQKKLDKAKKDGKVARSKEVTTFLQLSSCYCMLYLTTNYSNKFFENYHKVLRGKEWDSPEFILKISIDWFAFISIRVLFLLLLLWLVTFLSESFQVGLSFSMNRVGIKFSNINPLEGLKKIFGQRDNMKAPKGLMFYSLEVLVVGGIIISIILYCSMDSMFKFLHVGAETEIGMEMIESVRHLLGIVTLVFLVYAFYKYLMSKFRLKKELMMDIEELKREHKEDEGDPHVKGQRKSLYQEANLHGSIQNVRNAKVLIVSK